MQKEVRAAFGFGLMAGINYNEEGNFMVLFMNAHNPSTPRNNPYLDRYDDEEGLYHYTGKGKKGNQSLTGVNARLANSKLNGRDIHLFRQHSVGESHQYMGLVKLEKVISNIQPDENGRNRRVYEFLLKLIE